MSSPRADFVKAMDRLIDIVHLDAYTAPLLRALAVAFVDGICEFQEGHKSCRCKKHSYSHVVCRTKLLRECGLEKETP